jgi:2-polyprenyl-6-methoxyphenol hydroxylase-like FAD-dependent oxidoreductase
VTDVLIAGGGPAGSSLAILLARAGLCVELHDRARFPREKVCGEGLMPAGVAALGRLGVTVEGRPFRGVRYHCGELSVEGEFPGSAGTPARGSESEDIDWTGPCGKRPR